MSNTNRAQKGRYILIHTDGSCIGNPGPGGYAAVLRRMDGEVEIKRKVVRGREADATNNRMEMAAAAAALKALKPNEAAPIIIRTDCQMIVNAMSQNWIPGWIARNWLNSRKEPVANSDLWWRIEDAVGEKDVRFEWVKGHAGDPFNEEVNGLAQEQARKAARAARS